MSCENQDDLIALAHGDLVAALAREVEAHVAGCVPCQEELAWLRAERAVFQARSRAVPPGSVWMAIEKATAIEPPARAEGKIVSMDRARGRRLGRVTTWVAAVTAVAAGLAVTMNLRGRQSLGIAPLALRAPASDAGVGPVPFPPLEKHVPANAALDKAVAQYQTAIGTLEKDYQARRPALGARARRLDAKFEKMRHTVDAARTAAGDDVEGKRRVLKAYSAYLRTLSDALLSEGT